MDFAAMAELCAPGVASETLSKIASVESSFNPLAIGVVGGRLQRQPLNLPEALATVSMLETQGYDYSLGIVQVNQKNFVSLALAGALQVSRIVAKFNSRVVAQAKKDKDLISFQAEAAKRLLPLQPITDDKLKGDARQMTFPCDPTAPTPLCTLRAPTGTFVYLRA